LHAVVCRRRLSSSVTLPAGVPAGCRARGRSGGQHCTAGQSCYVPLGRHLIIISIIIIIVHKRTETETIRNSQRFAIVTGQTPLAVKSSRIIDTFQTFARLPTPQIHEVVSMCRLHKNIECNQDNSGKQEVWHNRQTTGRSI